jgi:Flp pilus assembly protein TadD
MRTSVPASRAGVALAVALVAVAVYAPVGGYSFVTLDDPGYVTANDLVLRGLTLDGVVRAFTEFRFANWHPLTWISHMADVSMFGAAPGDAGAHHLVNVAFHAANAALLFLFLAAATGAAAPAAFAALLFAVHPMHVESVAWVSERKDVLSVFFGLLALNAWAGYARHGRPSRYLLALLAFAASLLSKATLVTLPFLMLLLDAWPFRRAAFPGVAPEPGDAEGEPAVPRFPPVSWARALGEKAPFLAMSAAISVVTVAAQRSDGTVIDLADLPFRLRLENAVVSVAAYLGKAVWPSELAVLYPHPNAIPAWKAAGASILVAALTACAVAAWRRRPWVGVGWFWFLGGLVPMIGIVQVGRQAMADRYAYWPFIGLYVAVAFLAAGAAARAGRRGRYAVPVAVLCAVGALAVTARAQVACWKDSRALFGKLAATDPGDAWYNLGNGYLLEGKGMEAMDAFRKAVAGDPRHGRARTALAVELLKSGLAAEAVPLLEEAIRLEPDYVRSWYNLGAAYGRLGDERSALRIYEGVLAWRPRDSVALLAAGELRARAGDLEGAIALLRQAAAVSPGDREALEALRAAAIRAGRQDLAREAAERFAR